MVKLLQSDQVIIRRLESGDRVKVDRLRISNPSVMGEKVGKVWSVPIFLSLEARELYFNPKSQRYVGYGTFNGDELLSYMTVVFEGNAWYVRYISSSSSHRVLPFNGLGLLTEKIISDAEARGIDTFWYAFPFAYQLSHSRIWRRLTSRLDPYTREDVMVVEALSRPSDENVWKYLLSETPSFTKMLVRKNTLKHA